MATKRKLHKRRVDSNVPNSYRIFSVYLPSDMWKKLNAVGKKRGISNSAVVREYVRKLKIA